MKKNILIFAAVILNLVLLQGRLYAQNDTLVRKNNVYAELLGPAGVYSLNYERILLSQGRWFNLAAGAGFSVYNNFTFDFPVRAVLLAGPKSHKLELGGGFEPEFYSNKEYGSSSQTIWFLKIGYRYHKKTGGPLLGFAINPLFYPGTDWKQTWVSIDLGWNF
ncbi:MAG: hypothetical protein U0W24_12555 [Bacteroidales bacterium]